ncbi:MAG: tetratricopeptide repeat protein [Planctomycetes bacterium]|nr:tetratricopeptide repeat protein [Planctomycetota bacterium]
MRPNECSLLLAVPVPGDVRVEITGMVQDGATGELSIIIASDGVGAGLDGYVFQFGAHAGTSVRVIRQTRALGTIPGRGPVPGRMHRVRKLGQADQARALLERTLASSDCDRSDRAYLLQGIAFCDIDLGREDLARASIRLVIEEFNDCPRAQCSARDDLAFLLRNSGDIPGALEVLRPVMDHQESQIHASAVIWCGLFEMALGRPERARACWAHPVSRNDQGYQRQTNRFLQLMAGSPGAWQIDDHHRVLDPTDIHRRTSHRQREQLHSLIASVRSTTRTGGLTPRCDPHRSS